MDGAGRLRARTPCLRANLTDSSAHLNLSRSSGREDARAHAQTRQKRAHTTCQFVFKLVLKVLLLPNNRNNLCWRGWAHYRVFSMRCPFVNKHQREHQHTAKTSILMQMGRDYYIFPSINDNQNRLRGEKWLNWKTAEGKVQILQLVNLEGVFWLLPFSQEFIFLVLKPLLQLVALNFKINLLIWV